MNTYQPETWVCGNKQQIIWTCLGAIHAGDAVGREIRAPIGLAETICVDVIDEFFDRIGVKVK